MIKGIIPLNRTDPLSHREEMSWCCFTHGHQGSLWSSNCMLDKVEHNMDVCYHLISEAKSFHFSLAHNTHDRSMQKEKNSRFEMSNKNKHTAPFMWLAYSSAQCGLTLMWAVQLTVISKSVSQIGVLMLWYWNTPG